MCAVSMVTQHYFEKYPSPFTFPPGEFYDLNELRRKAALYDELMGQKDCVEPDKDAWFKKVQERIDVIEKKFS